MLKVIYDIGANNGDDIPYYLIKADLVVAIEANPALCELIGQRFATEIEDGRVIVENCVVTAEGVRGEIDFYIHQSNHVLSQMPPPSPERAGQFERVCLPSTPVLDIIAARGTPYYVKVDVEHYDQHILRALFSAGIHPPHISAESHSAEVFSVMVGLGKYDSFQLVDGRSVPTVYADHMIVSYPDHEMVTHSFPVHSAGPFGDDLDKEWMTADNFMQLLAFEGFGWKDIHATRIFTADPSVAPSMSKLFAIHFSERIDRKVRRFRRNARRKFRWLRIKARPVTKYVRTNR